MNTSHDYERVEVGLEKLHWDISGILYSKYIYMAELLKVRPYNPALYVAMRLSACPSVSTYTYQG